MGAIKQVSFKNGLLGKHPPYLWYKEDVFNVPKNLNHRYHPCERRREVLHDPKDGIVDMIRACYDEKSPKGCAIMEGESIESSVIGHAAYLGFAFGDPSCELVVDDRGCAFVDAYRRKSRIKSVREEVLDDRMLLNVKDRAYLEGRMEGTQDIEESVDALAGFFADAFIRVVEYRELTSGREKSCMRDGCDDPYELQSVGWLIFLQTIDIFWRHEDGSYMIG